MKVGEVEVDSVGQTLAFGERLGAVLQAGDVVSLIGPLGAGKTTLTKGVAAGAGVGDARIVNSPTFVIVNEYSARAGLHVYHIDAYRLRGAGDLVALGFDEMWMAGAVLIEWGDRVTGALPVDHLQIELEPTGETNRRITLRSGGPRSGQVLEAIAASLK